MMAELNWKKPGRSYSVGPSKLHRRPQPEALDGAGGRARRGDAVAVDVIELQFDIRIPIPVHAGRVLAVAAAIDEVVVEIDVAVAIDEFPRSPAA